MLPFCQGRRGVVARSKKHPNHLFWKVIGFRWQQKMEMKASLTGLCCFFFEFVVPCRAYENVEVHARENKLQGTI